MKLNAYIDKCLYCFSELSRGKCTYCNKKDKPIKSAGTLPPRSLLNDYYLITSVLGEGGFGVTYLAFDVRYAATVSIKEFFPAKAKRGEDYSVSVPFSEQLEFSKGIKRFVEEAKHMAEIKSLRGVVGVLNFFNENNTAYIVMEYIEGITLNEYIKKSGGKLHIAEVMTLLAPVMESLILIHDSGIIHRDISPDNIIISNSGAKLIDYGASSHNGKRIDVTLKRSFAPPEQFRRGYQDARTDIYALGVCIYFCVTGKLPPESIKRMEKETIVSPAKFANLPKEKEQAILKAMSIFPTDRYDNVRDFMDDLMI